jgi:hypothetical protein
MIDRRPFLLVHLRAAAICLSAIVVTACLPAGPSMIVADPSAQVDEPELSGTVVFQVRRNGEDVFDRFQDIRGVRVQQVNDDSEKAVTYRLRSIDANAPGVKLFVGFLPIGTYRITEFELHPRIQPVGQPPRTRMFAPKEYGWFSVLAGEVTDLGTVIVQPRMLGTSTVIGFSRAPATRDLVGMAAEILGARRLPANETRGWDDPNPDVMVPALLGYKARSPISAPFHVDDESILLTGNYLGDVLARRPDGEWRRINTGHHARLHFVTRLPDGHVLAGGDDATLLAAAGLDGKWERLDVPAGVYGIHAAHVDGGRVWLLTERRRYRAGIARAGSFGNHPVPERALDLVLADWPGMTQWSLLHSIDLESHQAVRYVAFSDSHAWVDLDGPASRFAGEQLPPRVARFPLSPDGRFGMDRQLGSLRATGPWLLAMLARQDGSEPDWAVRPATAGDWRFIRGIRMQQPPAVFEDGRVVAYGRKLGGAGARYPGYYVSDDWGATWEHWIDQPEDCRHGQEMTTVGGTLLQVCSLDRVFAIDRDGDEWRLEKPALLDPDPDAVDPEEGVSI